MGQMRVCALVYVVALYGWLAGPAGLCTGAALCCMLSSTITPGCFCTGASVRSG